MITLDVKTVLLGLLLVALIVLVIYIIVLAANALKALKRIVLILEDTQAVTAIVANRTDQLDEGIDSMMESVSSFKDGFKEKLSKDSPRVWFSNLQEMRNAGRTIKEILGGFSGMRSHVGNSVSGRAKRSLASEDNRTQRRARTSRFAPSRRNELGKKTADRTAQRIAKHEGREEKR